MRKLLLNAIVLLCLGLSLASPVAAAPEAQGGGIHVGAYTLEPGARASGDLTVLGGPVSLGEGSTFEGDLTVFGSLSMARGARLQGQLVVMGTAEIAGVVTGDVFCAGTTSLRSTGRVGGNVMAAGPVEMEDGAVIVGDLLSMEEGTSPAPWPLSDVGPFSNFQDWHRVFATGYMHSWFRWLWSFARGIVGAFVLALLAFVIVSLWPAQVERVEQAIEKSSVTAFGVGLLALVLIALVVALLTLTICLSPLAFIGAVVAGTSVLFGWIALGLLLGRRLLVDVFHQVEPATAIAAVVGTALLTVILALARGFGVLFVLLVCLLVPTAVGGIVLTRFGSISYTPLAMTGSPSLGEDEGHGRG